MRDFNRNRGGRRDSFEDRSGRSNRNGFSNRRNDGDRPQMFDAVCDNCGRDCRVPFRPTGDKPIYCSECFEMLGNGREDRGFIDQRSSKRNSFSSRGDFRENDHKESKDVSRELSQLKDQLGTVSAKLDKLIRLITPLLPQDSEIPMTEESKMRKKNRTVKS